MSQVGQVKSASDQRGTRAHEGAPLIDIRGLTVGFVPDGATEPRHVIRDVSFTIGQGEIVGLVGESGSGKTQTARAILRMNTRPLRPLGGQIFVDGVDVLALPETELRSVRGAKVAMIFQDPRSALNPLLRIGEQVGRVLALHRNLSKKAAQAEVLNMLQRVGIAGPERVARSYPHQLSGGMCQRVMISMALGIHPQLLIADEPTTGLDVTIQAQILDLLRDIRDETGTSVLLITHDLGVVAETCQRVVVMYAGRVVEIAPVTELFEQPVHPYTVRLLGSMLSPDGTADDLLEEPEFPTVNEFLIDGQSYVAGMDEVNTPGQATLTEVQPGHFVLCRPADEADASVRTTKARGA